MTPELIDASINLYAWIGVALALGTMLLSILTQKETWGTDCVLRFSAWVLVWPIMTLLLIIAVSRKR